MKSVKAKQDLFKLAIIEILKFKDKQMSDKESIGKEFLRLVNIMELLRSPEGCSWDRKQNMSTMGKHVENEAAEVVEALNAGDTLHIKEELGDLLMTIVMAAQIADENGTFDMGDVSHDICEKLILRHPHVFGDKGNNINTDKVLEQWGKIKVKEKADKARLTNKMKEAENFKSAIASIVKIQDIASSAGFDWNNPLEAFPKISEEAEEVKEALKVNDKENLEEEIGDLIFAVLNVARLSGVDAEKSLRMAGKKFVRRFDKVETLAEKNGGFEGKSLQQLDVYWNLAKEKGHKI